MKKVQKIIVAAIFAVTLLAGAFMITPAAASASGSSGNGMRVAPVRSDLTIQPGDSKVISIYLTNVTGVDATYNVLTNDFIASEDESGAPALLLNGETNDAHGLKKYMSTVDSVRVLAGKQREVKVTVTIPKGTPGGGYYGAVRFSQAAPNSDGNLSLSGSVASLILVRVPGDVTEKLSLVSFDASSGDQPRTLFTSSKDIQATVRLRNEGNIQEQPFGKIILKKGDKTLATYEVNGGDQPGNVLPDSVRRFTANLDKVGAFGKYTLEGNFGYGSNGQLLYAKATFYVVPVWAFVVGLLIVVTILFLIFGLPRIVRSYNRRVLRKAGRG